MRRNLEVLAKLRRHTRYHFRSGGLDVIQRIQAIDETRDKIGDPSDLELLQKTFARMK